MVSVVCQVFPTDLCPYTLRQIQYTVFNELRTLYQVRASECYSCVCQVHECLPCI